jgi:hypothetical protein
VGPGASRQVRRANGTPPGLVLVPARRNGVGPRSFISVPIKSAALGVVTVLAFGGLALLFAARHPYRWLIAGIFIGPSPPYLVTHVFIRYRYPLLWLAFLLGCECIARGINAARGSKTIQEPCCVG